MTHTHKLMITHSSKLACFSRSFDKSKNRPTKEILLIAGSQLLLHLAFSQVPALDLMRTLKLQLHVMSSWLANCSLTLRCLPACQVCLFAC